jgi:hypothetical protein
MSSLGQRAANLPDEFEEILGILQNDLAMSVHGERKPGVSRGFFDGTIGASEVDPSCAGWRVECGGVLSKGLDDVRRLNLIVDFACSGSGTSGTTG